MSERQFKPVRDSKVTLSQLMLPSHANFSGKIHGGYLLSLLDQVAFASASKFSGYYCVTASVDTVDFLAPIEIGELVTLKASVNYAGKSSMVVGIRVTAENITTGSVKHCNSSYFTMVAKDETGAKALVPGLLLSSPEEVRRYHHALQRIERRQASITEEAAFDHLSDHAFAKLSDHAVKISFPKK
ncbi:MULTISPECIES: acyl-CoA thioesterase [unclassified Flavobacterium]|uniref:acyl-CoA thioesterase n=1 Tax=unclassified Flavobacterium TaxID=196869 RepID=UPI001F12C6FB|nr:MULTISPECIES: acyl-CoA thioesterase [unclassified Flavobacterium]UMY67135.1 acyl-CoA thioesterase [Flavobacterium sp. HJ-32-4]